MSTYTRVRELLQEEVRRLGSINKVAVATGFTHTTIGRYLDGSAEPRIAAVEKLAAYFQKPVAWLRGDSLDGEIAARIPCRTENNLQRLLDRELQFGKTTQEIARLSGVSEECVAAAMSGKMPDDGELDRLSSYLRHPIATLRDTADLMALCNLMHEPDSKMKDAVMKLIELPKEAQTEIYKSILRAYADSMK